MAQQIKLRLIQTLRFIETHFHFLWMIILPLAIVFALLTTTLSYLAPNEAQFANTFIHYLVSAVFTAFYITIALYLIEHLYFKKPVSMPHILGTVQRRIGPMIITAFIYNFAVSIGTLLLIVPGIILAVRLALFPLLTMYKFNDFKQAALTSFGLTKPHALLIFTVGLILGLPFLPLMIIFVTFQPPLSQFTYGVLVHFYYFINLIFLYHLYQDLQQQLEWHRD